MTHEEFEKAAQYWNNKEQIQMPKEALKRNLRRHKNNDSNYMHR